MYRYPSGPTMCRSQLEFVNSTSPRSACLLNFDMFGSSLPVTTKCTSGGLLSGRFTHQNPP